MDWTNILNVLLEVITSKEVIIVILGALIYIKLVNYISDYKKKPKREKFTGIQKSQPKTDEAEEMEESESVYEEKSYNDDEYV